MCGVFGVVSRHTEGVLEDALTAMRHRGPDDMAVYRSGDLQLGMVRLAIIDLAHGQQPKRSADGQVVAFQNGEIYNHQRLAAELKALGHRFSSKSDTEVLAHGYAAWGAQRLARRLDGMFAVAIHDRAREQLHLFRDPFGEKPLYFVQQAGLFAYSSSLHSLQHLPEVEFDISAAGVNQYLATHYVPGDRTIFRGIRRVLPGHGLTVNLQTLACDHWRYYTPGRSSTPVTDESNWLEEFEDVVRSRLLADVPTGVFLSGGIDSSLIAALAARANPGIQTFSIGFDDQHADESAAAAVVARHIGSTHHEFRFNNAEFGALLPRVASALDEPIGDQATLPLYWLAEEASKHVKVALSGEGADEVFAGYSYYRQGVVQNTPAALLDWLAQCDLGLLNDVETASGFPAMTSRSDRNRLSGSTDIAGQSYLREFLQQLRATGDPLQRATLADLLTWLPDDLLVKADRMTMAHSLESRAPFLAPAVVEFGLNLPMARRMTERNTKVLLRDLAAQLLPASIVARPKHGFVLPMARWVEDWLAARGGLSGYARERLGDLLDTDYLLRMVPDLEVAGRDRLVFALIMLGEWQHDFQRRLHATRRGALVAR